MPQLKNLKAADSSALRGMKNTQAKMSNVLHHKDEDNCSRMRQLDLCKALPQSLIQDDFGEVEVHDKHRRQRQLTCSLFKIYEAQRAKTGALI